MFTSFILILILIFVYYEYKSNQHNHSFHRYHRGSNPLNVELNMHDICKAVNKTSMTDSDGKSKQCPKEEELAKQLDEQKQMTNELKLKYEVDPIQPYRFSDNDRFLLDSKYLLADDRLALKMKDTGSRGQEAANSRALWSKNNLVPYLEHELSNAANSGGWWEDDQLEADF